MIVTLVRRALAALLLCLAAVAALAPAATAAPLAGSQFETGDGNQDDGLHLDWQRAQATGSVRASPDANDDCFVGGVKELTPNQWAFNRSAGGCTPGKSNLRVAFANPESAPMTTFGHFAFLRNDTTGNTFLTFELNQQAASWTNATNTTIPCRSNGDLLLSFEVGGSSLTTSVYRWSGDGSGPAACPNGANGTFTGSGTVPAGRFQGTMNTASPVANLMSPGLYGASFPANAFGEAAVDLPAVLQSMGASPCFGFLQLQVHSRSSSSISSAMIDYTTPVPVYLQSCAVTGTQYQDTDGNGARDAGEPGLEGFGAYVDLDGDAQLDAGEPRGTSDADGFYRILGVPAGAFEVREIPKAGWTCSAPAPCRYARSLTATGNSTGNDFGRLGPSSASGTSFDDLDGDGTRDPGEPGRAGATAYADLDGDGAHDGAEPSGAADGTGAWRIDDIPAGAFTIREVIPAGRVCTTPGGCAATRSFTSGSAVSGLLFGTYAAAAVRADLFEDLDGDGAAREAGDVGLAGWQAYLDADGDDTFDVGERQATTDASGHVEIGGLAPGRYTLRVTAGAATWYCTRPGGDAAACERSITVTSGQTAATDVGLTRYATLSGSVFDDADNSGTKNGTEGAWTTGTTVYVDYDGDAIQDLDEPSAAVGASGTFAFATVRAGSATVRQVADAFSCTTPSGCAFALTPASGQTIANLLFGNWVDAQRGVKGTVYLDANANGVREAGETTPVPGQRVFADEDGDHVHDPAEMSTISDARGAYSVTFSGNGGVTVGAIAQNGWTCSWPNGPACWQTVNGLGSGKTATGKDFGVWGPSTVTGRVLEDLDADGVEDPGETTGLAGRTVYVDLDASGTPTGGDVTATTGADGSYTLSGIAPGTRTVRLAPSGSTTCSAPASCLHTLTVDGATVNGRNFLSYAPATISGTVFEDADADGAAREAGEAGLGGRIVFVDGDGDGVRDGGEPTATTDGSGAYAIAGLEPGAYTVRQELPAGWTQTVPATPATAVTVTSGATATRHLGAHTTGSIAGRAYEDSDFDNSAAEAGDASLDGRTVFLDVDGDEQHDAGEPQTTTAGGGLYTFAGLQPGDYTVRPVLAAGTACAYPAACAWPVTVTSGAAITGRDIGSYVGATVSGAVFEDADADGAAREPGDAGAAGRRVFLDGDGDRTRDAGEPAALTGADGTYELTGITARSWTVRVDLPAGWTCDRPAPCATDLVLTSGTTFAGNDFGVHTTASISGHLFTDRDNDRGPQAFGENDQPERTVYLDTDGDALHDAGERSVVTDDLGDFTFAGLEPGTYRVRQVLPAHWTCATPSPCAYDGVVVTSGAAVTGRDFSSWTTASFSGTSFEDEDADGDFPEPGERALTGRTVYVDLDEDGVDDAGEPAQIADARGDFRFTGLTPGSYVVRVADQPSGWRCSYPAPCSAALTLEAAEAAQDVSFGAWTTGTVRGDVLRDMDGDGVRSAPDTPLAGWTVFADLDRDDLADPGEPSTRTSAAGAYELTLDPGARDLRVIAPSGWSCADPATCERTPTVTSGGLHAGQDFVAARGTAISGTVFEDADGDGTQDAGEAGRAGVRVFADAQGNDAFDAGEPEATTDGDGDYALTGLAAGAHAVRVDTPAGWLCLTTDCEHAVTLTAGADEPGRDFAIARSAAIGGTVVEDLDGDGVIDAGEPGRGGRTVFADADGDGTRDGGEPTALTDAGGAYRLTGLAPGARRIRLDVPAAQICSVPASCRHDVTLASGDDMTGRDLAFFAPTTIAGTVTEDHDADGSVDPGDDGLAGRTAHLDVDRDGVEDPGEPTTTTGADGTYGFAGVDPGSFAVRFPVPGGWTCSVPASCRVPVTVTSGTPVAAVDASLFLGATLSGTVAEDADADGTIDAGEGPLAGAGVYADTNGDERRGAGEPTATPAGDGTWSLTLAPGGHTIRLDGPAGSTCSVPAGCGHTRTLGSGQAAGGLDLAAWRPASIAGTVREDADADGTPDGPLAGRTLFLDADDDGTRDTGEPQAASAADGRYAFTGLRPGARTVRAEGPAGWACAAPAPCRRTATVTSAQALAGQDFTWSRPKPAPVAPGSPAPAPAPTPASVVTGTLFEDRDADGAGQEPGEPALAGWTVFADLDGDGAAGTGEPSTTTGADGRYRFTGLAAGRYAMRVVPRSNRWICSLPPGCVRVVTLTADGRAEGQDFAAWRRARLVGVKFLDMDRDGSAHESGDRVLGGWTVYADLNGNGRHDDGEPSDVTDVNGRYGLTNLPLGTYAVRDVPPAGARYRCSYPETCSRTFTVASGEEDRTADFGAVAGVQELSREARLRTPPSCRRGRFAVRVFAPLARRIGPVRVDGRRVAARVRRTRTGATSTLDARRFTRSVHRLAAKVTFLDGSTRTVRSTFYRCSPARPRYTG